jgi:hypothetical protein
MHRKAMSCAFAIAVSAFGVAAQECKLKFAVAYTDGKNTQVGLTDDQKKFWLKDGPKKFKGLCPDANKPDYIILWSEGMSGGELAQSSVDAFNRGRSTGQTASLGGTASSEKTSTTDTRWTDSTVIIGQSALVRAKVDYWILDTSKTPYAMIRKGQGYRDMPSNMGVANNPGEKASSADMASTIADPAVALENALKWLKKEKKI